MIKLSTVARTVCAAVVFTAGAASAQAVAVNAPANDALFQALGAKPGLTKLVDDVDQKDLKAKLVTQFCEVSGGPCTLKDHDMKKKHEEMKIDKSNFNALVEVLQQSMDAQGIAFSTQNQLLAMLAPLHREIVNVH